MKSLAFWSKIEYEIGIYLNSEKCLQVLFDLATKKKMIMSIGNEYSSVVNLSWDIVARGKVKHS